MPKPAFSNLESSGFFFFGFNGLSESIERAHDAVAILHAGRQKGIFRLFRLARF